MQWNLKSTYLNHLNPIWLAHQSAILEYFLILLWEKLFAENSRLTSLRVVRLSSCYFQQRSSLGSSFFDNCAVLILGVRNMTMFKTKWHGNSFMRNWDLINTLNQVLCSLCVKDLNKESIFCGKDSPKIADQHIHKTCNVLWAWR